MWLMYIEMKIEKKMFFVFVLVLLALGAALCLDPTITKENLENMLSDEVPLERVQMGQNECPNLLIRSADRLYLHNTNVVQSDSNPVVFENLDSYLEYLKTQRLQNNSACPILFLQEENDTQGQNVYRMRPSPTSMEGGGQTAPIRIVDGSRDNPPYNQNQYAGFDPIGFNQGQFTELDQIHNSTATANISDNPMDPNWGGTLFSREAVESGKYAGNEVGKATLVPKVVEIYK